MNKFIEYKDTNEYGNTEIVRGVFEVVEENVSFIKFKTKRNTLTLPWHRVNKVKE